MGEMRDALTKKRGEPRIFPPGRAWLILNAVSLTIFAATAFWFVRFSATENQRLIDSQWETLTRSRLADLNRGDYRSFVEGVGRDFSNLYLEISEGAALFSAGDKPKDGHCRSGAIDVIRNRDLSHIKVLMCRPFRSPFSIYATLALLYVLVALLSVRMISLLEAASVTKLSKFFQSAGIKTKPADGMVGILSRLEEILTALSCAQAKEVEAARSNALGQFAAQVAHDLRSPIMALNVALDDISMLPEAKRALAVNSVARVRDIAKSLMEKERKLRLSNARTDETSLFEPSTEPATVVDIAPVIQSVFEEKRAVLSAAGASAVKLHWEPEVDENPTRSQVQLGELSRLVSNLLNNAAESIDDRGHVIVVLRSTADFVVLEITDTGRGIPEHLMGRLGTRGFTFGKTDGSGLGLYHAKATVESWNGSFAVESIEGEGTMVAIGLPRVP